jgi:hypothetical protein
MVDKYNNIVNDYILPLITFVTLTTLICLGALKALEIAGLAPC